MIDQHYEDTYRRLTLGKDSIFEPCKILSFDTSKMTANVYFMRSTKEKEDAIVLFPALSASNGTLTIPTKDTTALAFWGPDRQVYVLPTQFMTPKYDLSNGVVKQDASVERHDKDLSLAHLEPGDVFHFGPGGHLLITGPEVELMSRSMAHLKIEEDGTIRIGGKALQVRTDTYDDAVTHSTVDGYATSERKVTHYETNEPNLQEAHLYAREMARLLTMTDDPDVFDVSMPDLRREVLSERSGILLDGDGHIKTLEDGERVVKETVAGDVTIMVGENGTVRVERPGLTLEVKDDVAIMKEKGRLRLDRLIERVEELSLLAGIEEGLYET